MLDAAARWAALRPAFDTETSLDESIILDGIDLAVALDQPDTIRILAPWVARLDNIAAKIRFCDTVRQRGQICQKQGDYHGALIHWQALIQIAPRQIEIWRDIAECFRRQERWAEERHALEQAMAQKPDDPWLLFFYGYVLERFQDFDAGLAAHQKAFALRPDIPEIMAALDYSARRAGAWADVEQVMPLLAATHKNRQHPTESALHLPYRYDDDAIINPLLAAWAQEFDNARTPPRIDAPLRDGTPNRVIKIGYLSGDFYDHPVMHLLAGLFAGHDRRQFHITALSIGPRHDDEFRRRVIRDADVFLDLQGLGDEALAQRIADQQIDILVDLKGMTMPLGVLAYRPAPIIASWLGFPGTTGADYVDYLIADRYVIPASARPAYPEAIACLPISYLLTDDRQAKKPPLPPAQAFPGFAAGTCFIGNWCHPAKIQRDVFAAWIAILQQCPHAVLVLKKPQDSVIRRYQSHLTDAGIDPARLIFGRYMAKDDHFARLGALDLSLDTWLYGSHSTGCDALWAGVPLLTRRGSHFASRVAESLLHGVGLTELIADSTDDYIQKAVALLNNPAERQRLKQHLQDPASLPLFQTDARIRELESLYRQMWQRACTGLPPGDIDTKKASGL